MMVISINAAKGLYLYLVSILMAITAVTMIKNVVISLVKPSLFNLSFFVMPMRIQKMKPKPYNNPIVLSCPKTN